MKASFKADSLQPGHRLEMTITSGSETHDIWFTCNALPLHPSGNALFTAALIPAMRAGEPLSIHAPVSPFMLTSWEPLNGVLSAWHDCLHPVALHAPASAPPHRPNRRRSACFFTGGVDSCYTLLKHRDDIDTLIYVYGFDLPLEDSELRQTVSRKLHEAAASFGKQLIEIETNLKHLFEHFIERGWGTITHGSALATIAHLLQHEFDMVFVPASGHYSTLKPWGSDPLLDLLWSSESLRLFHDGGEATRFGKARQISQSPEAMGVLRVCWENRNGAYNCGSCEKCLRTMLFLEALGKQDACHTFDRKPRFDRLAAMNLETPFLRSFYFEALEEMMRQNIRPDLQKIVLTLLWPYRNAAPPGKEHLLRECRAALRRHRLADALHRSRRLFCARRRKNQTNIPTKNAPHEAPAHKIFGIGWAKTGTTTLGQCFQLLGYKHQGQRLDLIEDLAKPDLSRIMALAAQKETFEDWPWILPYKEFDAVFPGSRFVLTIREPDSWLRSYKNMLHVIGSPTAAENRMRRILYGLPFPDVSDNALLERYLRHNNEVRDYFRNRPNDLLVVDWGQGDGWQKLCAFLEKPVPDIPFPHANPGESLIDNQERLA